MTNSGLQQQSDSRLSREEQGLCLNPQERALPSCLQTYSRHQFIQLSEEKWGPGVKTSGVWALKEDIVPDFDFFFGLTARKDTGSDDHWDFM